MAAGQKPIPEESVNCRYPRQRNSSQSAAMTKLIARRPSPTKSTEAKVSVRPARLDDRKALYSGTLRRAENLTRKLETSQVFRHH